MDETKESKGHILIGHLADTHLRDTQYARAARGVDFAAAATDAVEKACEACDILVLVGDIFDRPRPSPKVVGQLMRIDRIIASAGKKCLAVTGNHDWCKPTWLDTLFPDRTADDVGIIGIDGKTVEVMGFKFAGIKPYNGVTFRSNLADIETQARGSDVVLYHGFVDGVAPFFAGLKDPLHVDEFPLAKDNKAWLLGDIHVQAFVEKDRPGGGKTLVGYPGSTEMCSSSENLDKSVPVIKLTKDTAEHVESLPVTTRPYVTMGVMAEEDIDELIKTVTPVADQHPVVVVKFKSELSSVISRLHGILDAQRALIRCTPLPKEIDVIKRVQDAVDADQLGIEHFMAKKFDHNEELQDVALQMLVRGSDDANSITTDFVESRINSAGVRDESEA